MIKIQDGRGGWNGLASQPFGDRDSAWQWQPDTDSHDPNPPLTLETAVAPPAGGTMVLVWGDH